MLTLVPDWTLSGLIDSNFFVVTRKGLDTYSCSSTLTEEDSIGTYKYSYKQVRVSSIKVSVYLAAGKILCIGIIYRVIVKRGFDIPLYETSTDSSCSVIPINENSPGSRKGPKSCLPMTCLQHMWRKCISKAMRGPFFLLFWKPGPGRLLPQLGSGYRTTLLALLIRFLTRFT